MADQSDEEQADSSYYGLLPKTFYRYKVNPPANNLSQSTSEHASLQNTEGNLFSNLMNLPSLINTSFSSSALPTDNVLGKLFSNLSPAHHKSSSSKLSSNQEY